MNRRKFLSLMGIVSISPLSGCVDYVTTGDEKIKQTRDMRIKNIKSDELKTDMIDINIQQLTSNSDNNNPLKLSISITNKRERDIQIGGTNGKIFGEQKSEDDNLILLRDEEWSEDMINKKCWSIKEPYPLIESDYNALIRPEESRNVEYYIFGNYQTECMKPKTYRFETYYELKDAAKLEGTFETRFGWGFDIQIV